MIKLNLTGHQNNALEEMGFHFPGAIQINIEKPFKENLENITDFLKGLGVNSSSRVYLAPPGMTYLNMLVFIAIHGLTGSFPVILTFKMTSSGKFIPNETDLDLQKMRSYIVRQKREESIAI